MELTDIPQDSDGDAIRRVLNHGSDSSRPMKIDFHVAAPNEESGRKVMEAAIVKHYEASLDRDDDEAGAWTCTCSRIMLLDYDVIVRAQMELDALSAPYDGYSDGWKRQRPAG